MEQASMAYVKSNNTQKEAYETKLRMKKNVMFQSRQIGMAITAEWVIQKSLWYS